MGKLSEILNSKLEATDALIFYKSTVKGAYVEHRAIKDGQMRAGKPLKTGVLVKMMKAVEKFAHDSSTMVSLYGEIPPNLLYASTNIDSYKLVWYRKPEKRMMYFAESLEIPNGEIKVPGLVYSTDGRGLRVFAYKGGKPRSLLYYAPFFNVSEHVCLGNAKMKKPVKPTYEAWMRYWEDMFWKSEFVHILGANPVNGNLALITKECIEQGKPFPLSVLKRTKITLKRLYEL